MTAQRNTVQMLAPEDIRAGHYVCVLHVIYEMPPFFGGSEFGGGPRSPPSYLCLPDDDETTLKVVEVCLPFVLAEQPGGKTRTLDVRRHRLARVSDRFARKVFMRARAVAARGTPDGEAS